MNTLISNLTGRSKLILSAAAFSAMLNLQPQQAAAQNRQDKVTTVTFQKDKFNRIFIPTKIDGDTIEMLFGTYSKTLRLTPYFVEHRDLYPSWDRLTLINKKGYRRSRMVFYLPKMEIGNIKFYNEESIINTAFPDSVATGSTGTLLVNQYNWKVNNDRNEVSISKKPFNPQQAFITISYKKDIAPSAPVQIEGTTGDFALDFGSGTTFQINSGSALGKQLIARYNLNPKTTLTSNIHARKLVDTIYEVTVPSLLLNGTELKNQKVVLSSAAPNNIIGTGFLGNYNVIMNNSRKRKIESTFILEKRLID
jgi:hypothetical protein